MAITKHSAYCPAVRFFTTNQQQYDVPISIVEGVVELVGVERFSLESVFSITDAVSVVNNQSLMKKTPMGQILPTTFISNNDINGSTESHT